MNKSLTGFIERNTGSPRDFLNLYSRSLGLVQAIAVATRLNLPELTSEDSIPICELARLCEANEDNLRRLIGALATVGIFEFDGDAVKLSAEAACLAPSHPETIASVPALSSFDWAFVPWGYLYDSVKTGEIAFNKAFGMGLFEYLPNNPEAAAQFNRGMADQSGYAKEIGAAFDFSSVSEFIDIGGGIGGVARGILAEYPNLKGAIFDLPAHKAQAEACILEDELSERCSFTGGSFFESVPPSQCYLLRYILHDWNDRDVVTILASCKKELKPGGVILIADEQLNEATPGSFLDLNMMVFTGGRERTLGDLTKLAESVGLRVRSNTHLSRDNYLTVLVSDRGEG
jgi:hypothetical protein